MKCIFVHIYISIQDKTTIENILDFEKTFYFIPDSRKYKNYVKLCRLSRNICKKMYSWSQQFHILVHRYCPDLGTTLYLVWRKKRKVGP